MTDKDVSTLDPAAANWTAFQRALTSGHESYLRQARKFNAYYLGEQWAKEDLDKLDEQGRPALTLNEVLQIVNTVHGQYSATRADIVTRPKRNGANDAIANSLTRLIDHILEENDFHDRVEPQVFDDGIIEDRGFFDVRLDFSENMLGEVRITAVDPRTVIIDPGASDYDPSTWGEVWRDRWLSLDDIELFYGKDKRRSVTAVAADPQSTFGERSVRYETYGEDSPWVPTDARDERRVKSVRVIERQYRRLAMVREFVHLITGEARPVPEDWEEARVQAVARAHQLGVRKRMQKRVRWTVSADHVLLHDDWSPYDDFTIIPYFPLFRRGRPSGLVRHIVDPQDQLNKVESQGLHIINTTANSGWVVEAGSLVNMSTEELEERGAETGLVLVYAKNRQPPAKIEPNTIPTGLENYSQKALGYIQGIPGAAGLLGQQPKAEVSGVALEQSQSRALMGLQVVFDNLNFTRKLLARRVMRVVQKHYTEPRVFHITDWRDPEAPQQEVAINQQAAGAIVNDITVGEYEVVVATAPARETFQETQFAEALQLREAGVNIPDHHIILASHLQGKRKIAEEVKQLAGLGDPTPEQQQMAELQMQMLQLQAAELEAKVGELQARTQLQRAKAQTEVAGEQREMLDLQAQYQMEAERLRADLQKKMADLQNKLQLAAVHAGNKEGLTRFQTLMQRNENQRDREADLDKAVLQSQTQLTASGMQAQAARQRPEAPRQRRR